MKKIEIKYYKFWNRLLIRSGFIVLLISYFLFRSVINIRHDLDISNYTELNYILLVILLAFFLQCFHRSRYYLSELQIDEKGISITRNKYDKVLESVRIEYEDLDVDIHLNFLSIFNNYRLELRERSKTKKFTWDLVHKQYEIGYWKRSRLKEIYTILREKQGQLSNVDHIK